MRLLFVHPGLGRGRARDSLEPAAFSILKARTPATVSCALFDERVEDAPPEGFQPDLVAITVGTYTAARAYALARSWRDRAVPVVLGGVHVSLAPDEASEHADAIVTGNGEGPWPSVLDDAIHGRLKKHYEGSFLEVKPDRGLFADKRYAPMHLLRFGEGCPCHCEFCCTPALPDPSPRHREVGDVIEEVKGLRRKLFFFADDNLLLDRARTMALLKALVPLKCHWAGQVGLAAGRDPELLELMARSGCVALVVGLESLSRSNLRQMGKTVNLAAEDPSPAIAAITRRGIMVYGTFVFGYDGDTEQSPAQAVRFAREHGLFITNLNPLCPMPGTALHRRLEAEGRLLRDRWWLDPSARYGELVFRPAATTAEALASAIFEARRTFYGPLSCLGRFWRGSANHAHLLHALLFWQANLVSGYEIRRKQGAATRQG